MNVYENAITSFSNFRRSFGIEEIWPPTIDHLINYVAYLSKTGYSAKTARTYLSGVNYKMKINNWYDYSESFILEKMLSGMHRLNKRSDSRKPITIDILTQIIPKLQYVCSSSYETQMFKAAFCLAFFGFMRIGEISYISRATDNHIVKISDISFDDKNSELLVKEPSSKTDQ